MDIYISDEMRRLMSLDASERRGFLKRGGFEWSLHGQHLQRFVDTLVRTIARALGVVVERVELDGKTSGPIIRSYFKSAGELCRINVGVSDGVFAAYDRAMIDAKAKIAGDDVAKKWIAEHGKPTP